MSLTRQLSWPSPWQISCLFFLNKSRSRRSGFSANILLSARESVHHRNGHHHQLSHGSGSDPRDYLSNIRLNKIIFLINILSLASCVNVERNRNVCEYSSVFIFHQKFDLRQHEKGFWHSRLWLCPWLLQQNAPGNIPSERENRNFFGQETGEIKFIDKRII